MPHLLNTMNAGNGLAAAKDWARAVLRPVVAGLLSILTIAWAAFVIARVPVLSGLNRIAGDTLDGELALGIELHWSNVLHGTALSWRTTDYFYPVKDTLGYNESFFLHGVLLAIFRWFGADIFLGMQLVDWSFHAIGFVSVCTLAYRCLRWPLFVSVAASAVFVTANCYYPHVAIHAQFLTCYLIPLLLLL